MGLLKAVFSAVSSTMADQWKEFFYCEALPSNVLVTKGQKQVSGKSSNTKGSENIITNGSGIAVADGQCMIIVDNGRVVELCAEPGQYTYDTSTEPSIFSGSLGNSIKETFKKIGARIGYGGDTGHDQRIYYFNLKEIMNNKFGTQNPVPFRIVDRNINLDIDISIRCNGEYTYRIADPMLFYTNVCGNVSQSYTSDQIAGTLKAEFLTALQPAFAQISAQGVRYSALPGYTQEITDAMNQALAQKWREKRGIEIVSVMINSATASKEDEDLIKQAQRAGMLQSPGMAAATLTAAQADAMKTAAGNSGGAHVGFMNMNLAQQTGGLNAQALYQMQAQQMHSARPATSVPENADSWSCVCGASNTGKFCAECGKPKPAGAKTYRCDKCGWKPADPSKPPRFCPECGDVFDANDEVTE